MSNKQLSDQLNMSDPSDERKAEWEALQAAGQCWLAPYDAGSLELLRYVGLHPG